MRHVIYQATFRDGRLCEVLTWIVPEARLHAVRAKRMRRAARRHGGDPEEIVRAGTGWIQYWGWRMRGATADVRWRVRGHLPWLAPAPPPKVEERDLPAWREFFAIPNDNAQETRP